MGSRTTLRGDCRAIASACSIGTFEQAGATTTSDRLCTPLRPTCSKGPEVAAPTGVSDRLCHTCPGESAMLTDPLVGGPDALAPLSPAADASVLVAVPWGLAPTEEADVTVISGTTVRWDWTQPDISVNFKGGTRFNTSGTSNGKWERQLKGPAKQGSVYAFKFLVPGVYPYHSTPFLAMAGRVTVVEQGQNTFAVDWGIVSTASRRLTIGQGDTITWVWGARSSGVNLVEQTTPPNTGTVADPTQGGSFYTRRFTDVGVVEFASGDGSQKLTVVVKRADAAVLNPVTQRAVVKVAPLASPNNGDNNGLCHDVSAKTLVDALQAYSKRINGAAFIDCAANASEVRVGIAVYDTLEARMKQRVQAASNEIKDILDGWDDSTSSSDDVKASILWLRTTNAGGLPACKAALSKRLADLGYDKVQLGFGSSGVDFSRDGGSSWTPVRRSRPEDGMLVDVGSASASASQVRFRVSPSRTFRGLAHVFSYRLWPIFTNYPYSSTFGTRSPLFSHHVSVYMR